MRQLMVAVVAVVLVAASYGACFVIDAQPSRTTSWPVFLGLMFLAGMVGLGSGLVAEKIADSDDVSDPILRRVGRLLLLLCAAAVAFVVLHSILNRT